MAKQAIQNRLNQVFAKFPTQRAVEYGSRMMSYRELEECSLHLAAWILNHGIKEGSFLGIMVEDRLKFITLIIGILRARCVFVPLDPVYPPARLKLMVETTDLSWVFVDESNHGLFTGSDIDSPPAASSQEHPPVEFIRVEKLFDSDTLADDSFHPSSPPGPGDKIYIYFTSGTSGTPKAVLGKNKSLLHFIDWEIETFHINHQSRISQFITPGFDAFLRDVFAPLCAGGCLCIPENKDIILKPRELVKWIDANRIYLMHGVPSFFRLVIAQPLTPDHFKALKYVLLSGEKINPTDLKEWYNIFSDKIRLVNLYGPTETTMIKTAYFIRPQDVHLERMPIGKPMPGARLMVCDENMNICDKLVTGELYIRTPFRTFGYYNDPELNRERFIPNPFKNDSDDLFYRTGDLGRLLADDNFELIGRIDRQIKIRGIRIEPEEIENLMEKYPSVKEAVVIKKEVSSTSEMLIAYISEKGKNTGGKTNMTTQQKETMRKNLQKYLAGHLPEYMIPAHIIILDTLPRKPNGKIHYDALPDPLQDNSEGTLLPRNPIEKAMLEVWRNVLQIEKIAVNKDFFQLGGHSLNVMSLISHIHKDFDYKLSLADIFRNPTIEKQARVIKNSRMEKFLSIQPVEKKEYYELSSAQQRMYVIQQSSPDSTVYNMMRDVIPFKGVIEKRKLTEIFKKLIKKHESLRTCFITVKGWPAQQVPDQVDFKVEHYDLALYNYEPGASSITRIINDFIRPFDITAAPLLRVGLVKIGENQYVLMVDMHHIISDDISNEILARDFMALYRGSQLPAYKLQYKDYSEWQTANREKDMIKQQKTYWLDQFRIEPPVLNLPSDFPRAVNPGYEGKSYIFDMGIETTTQLKELTLEVGATMFMTVLAIFTVFLSKTSGQEDIIVGTPLAGRRHADLEQIIGVFINTLALRNYPRQGNTFICFLKEVKERTLSAFDNQEYPFDDLVSQVTPDNHPDLDSLFRVMFSLDIGQEKADPQKETGPWDITLTSKFDLVLKSKLEGNNLYFNVLYRSRLFCQETIKTFIIYFKEITNQVLVNKEIMLQDIRLTHHLLSTNTDNPSIVFDFSN